MLTRYISIAAAAFLFVAGPLARHAAAQGLGTFTAGLSFMSDEGSATGFAVNLAKEITDGSVRLAPVGDFSLHSEGGTWTTIAGGIRTTGHPEGSRIVPFGQFLAGASIVDFFGTHTFMTFVYGGGVHVPVGERLNVVFQFDLVRVSADGEGETGKRTTLGISIPFGGR